MKITLYTLLALVAFAGNSVLCRLALGDEAADASSFTTIRLVSGAVVLYVLFQFSQISYFNTGSTKSRGENTVNPNVSEPKKSANGSWLAASLLFIYAGGFSYAYLSLDTGMGALILFASVQITMILAGLVTGNRLKVLEWVGVLISIGGFAYLMLPGAGSPSFVGFVLMSCAGIAWGFYSLLGRGSLNPLADTALNFIRTLPLVAVMALFTLEDMQMSEKGVWLAMLSGAVTSGIGYTIWYMALRGLAAVQAAVLQLSVPVLATLGGVIFANEHLTLRLLLASLFILGGILLVILAKQAPSTLKASASANR